MTPAAQRRGAIYAALGTVACVGLLVLWPDAPEPPATQPLATGPLSSSRVDSDSASEATVLDRRDPLGAPILGAPIVAPTSDLPTIDALIVALGDADANVRMDAVSDLGLSSDPRAESLLAVTAMQDPMPQVRVEALYALETLRVESEPRSESPDEAE